LHDDFKQCLEKTVLDLLRDEDTRVFSKYFVTYYYANRPECWVYCHLQGLGLNTNNHLEAFHKNLKHIYLEGKKIKRLDKTIHAVLNVARDSLFKRLIRLTKQSSDHKTDRIHKSHKKSYGIGSEMVKTVNPGSEWLVKSLTSDDYYSVSKINDVCAGQCIMRTPCKICVHSYKCTCLDNVIRTNIC
jgi:hypothetical protein